MSNPLIAEQAAFDELCQHIRETGIAAFDSEFVSEDTYRPQLCLLQVATPERCVAVDPFAVDLTAWWSVMTDEETTVVVHGGRAEVDFCLWLSGGRPRRLIDVQIAEGLRSRSYPLGFGQLLNRVLGRKPRGKETRTDWRRRPLNARQINYALEDVRYLLDIWDVQRRSLEKLGRLSWAEAEFERLIRDTEAEHSRESWRRLPKLGKLAPRELAVARELAAWRDREAEQRNQPVRRVLRDDLIIELARRQPANRNDLLALRDMQQGRFKKATEPILECVQRGQAVPEAELPDVARDTGSAQDRDEQVIGRLLGIALANRCAEMDVAQQLVGTNTDLRHLVRWHVYGEQTGPPPRLTQGWRAELCGDLLTDVLDGKVALRVAHPDSDHPLVFERDGADHAGYDRN